MDRACKSCESLDFAIENCERVCTNCGEVQEELPGDEGDLRMLSDNQIITDNIGNKDFDANDRLTNRVRGETQCAESRRQISRNKNLDEMRRVVRLLVKEPSAVEETMDLVSSTFQAYQGRMLTSKKCGLAGACIYYLSAKHQLGISLNDICKVLGIKMKVISVCLKQVKSLCPNFEYERPNIKDLVRKFIRQISSKTFDVNSLDTTSQCGTSADTSQGESQPLIDSKDKKVLHDRVMLLLDLFEVMHPYKQPTPQSLVTAVIYHAWRSLDTFKLIALNLKRDLREDTESPSPDLVIDTDEQINRRAIMAKHSIGYEKFCQLCNLKYSSNGHKIVTKLQSSLLMLGKYLGDVNKLNLPLFLKDIIDNAPHLIQEHKRTGSTLTTEEPSTQDCDS